jgi:hypothetical protein
MLGAIDQRTCLLPGQYLAPSRRGLDQTVSKFPAFGRAQPRRPGRLAARLAQVERYAGPKQAAEDSWSRKLNSHFGNLTLPSRNH